MLSGCTLVAEQGVANGSHLAVVDEWIRAVNAEDVAGFKKLHTKSVFWTNHSSIRPFTGRELIWDLLQMSTGNQIEKLVAFG